MKPEPPTSSNRWVDLRHDPSFAQAFFEAYRKASVPLQLTLLRTLAGISQLGLAKKAKVKQTHHSRLEIDDSDHLLSIYEKMGKLLRAKLVLIPDEAQITIRKKKSKRT